ncbi:MAG TPA: ShET2/EspL2 family type III secretion system effector toxin [Methylibium sp.]|uniref:ShET2/EspL2 family type III secretion system effector toxin n=1 Tax=Methylibium sp. TaxID=2067992 RepID=UPI002DBC31C3|nr:ShET2/EspL2 family type III secretion system effector toxin [Methylibium sp.]HEU4459754.1 ShET2/EspL2 family type III secretion system effector toxin [Methylibium sp.]
MPISCFPSLPLGSRTQSSAPEGAAERKSQVREALGTYAGAGGPLAALTPNPRRAVAKDITAAHRMRVPLLDLTSRNSQAVAHLPAQIGPLLGSHVQELRLPSDLPALPQWVADLPRLQRLDARGATGDVLTLARAELVEINVPPGTQVENRIAADRKTRINHVAGGQVVGTASAVGQSYLANAELGRTQVDLNGKVRFLRGTQEQIVCRHLAIRDILDAQKLDADKQVPHDRRTAVLPTNRAQQRERLMGTPARMQRHVDTAMEDRFNELRIAGTDTVLAGHSEWGQMMSDRFAAMNGPGTQHLLVLMGNHAMSLSLKAKQIDGKPPGTMTYSVSLYDPNQTVTHVRLTETDPARIRSLAMKDLIRNARDRSEYYSADKEIPFNGPVTKFVVVPDGAYAKKNGEPMVAAGAQRQLTMYVGDADRLSMASLFHIVDAELPARDALLNGLAAQRDRAGRIDYLQRAGAVALTAPSTTVDLSKTLRDQMKIDRLGTDDLQTILVGITAHQARKNDLPRHLTDVGVGARLHYLVDSLDLDSTSRHAIGQALFNDTHTRDAARGTWTINHEFGAATDAPGTRDAAHAYLASVLGLMQAPAPLVGPLLVSVAEAHSPQERAAFLERMGGSVVVDAPESADNFGDALGQLSRRNQLGGADVVALLLSLRHKDASIAELCIQHDDASMVDSYAAIIDAAGLDAAERETLGRRLLEATHRPDPHGGWVPHATLDAALTGGAAAPAFNALLDRLLNAAMADESGNESDISVVSLPGPKSA